MKKLVFVLFAFFVWSGRAEAALTFVHTTAGITTASTLALAAKSKRRAFILVNDSDTTIYCNLTGSTAVVGEGIRLNADGGNIVLDTTVPDSAIYCIHAGSGTKNVLMTEDQ